MGGLDSRPPLLAYRAKIKATTPATKGILGSADKPSIPMARVVTITGPNNYNKITFNPSIVA